MRKKIKRWHVGPTSSWPFRTGANYIQVWIKSQLCHFCQCVLFLIPPGTAPNVAICTQCPLASRGSSDEEWLMVVSGFLVCGCLSDTFKIVCPMKVWLSYLLWVPLSLYYWGSCASWYSTNLGSFWLPCPETPLPSFPSSFLGIPSTYICTFDGILSSTWVWYFSVL